MAGRKKSGSKMKRKPSGKVVKLKRTSGKKRSTASSKSSAGKKTSAPISVGRKPYSKSQFVSEIADRTGVSRKEVSAVLETIGKIIGAHVSKSGPEIFSWPGMFKIQVVKKPATKSRQGVNPFTGEPMTFKAKPASRRIKVRALKQLKEMAA